MYEEIKTILSTTLSNLENYKQKILNEKESKISNEKIARDNTDIADEFQKNNKQAEELTQKLATQNSVEMNALIEKNKKEQEELLERQNNDIDLLKSKHTNDLAKIINTRDALNANYKNRVYKEIENKFESENILLIKQIEDKKAFVKKEIEAIKG